MSDDTFTEVAVFQNTVWDYYHDRGRHDLPWRKPKQNGFFDPYRILLSEIMLQQTQVNRVIPKYQEFLLVFPTLDALAAAELGEVLRRWTGLGYNRRAKFLHQAAQAIQSQHTGMVPQTAAELVCLPGIGPNTAGAILAYSYNQPVIFVETNIRTVIIHHFFADQHNVTDKLVLEKARQMLDHEHPREWYWALMDYGAYLKQSVGSLNHQSKSYTKQSKFHGSRRQIRGQVVQLLGQKPRTATQLQDLVQDERLKGVLQELLKEELIRKIGKSYSL